MYKVYLDIGGVNIKLISRHKIQLLSNDYGRRYQDFIVKRCKGIDVFFKVDLVDRLPKLRGAERLFATVRKGNINCALFRKGNLKIFEQYIRVKGLRACMNSGFDRGRISILKKKTNNTQWNLADIIYDFLQIVLINYLAANDGILVHSVGIKEKERGFLFVGKSGSGKSTTARIWVKHSRADILNDDRIILRKIRNNYYIFGSPWSTENSFKSMIAPVKLEKLFFIYHAQKNQATRITTGKAFGNFFPNIFPPFWDEGLIGNTINFLIDTCSFLPCYRLGFVNDGRLIKYIRALG